VIDRSSEVTPDVGLVVSRVLPLLSEFVGRYARLICFPLCVAISVLVHASAVTSIILASSIDLHFAELADFGNPHYQGSVHVILQHAADIASLYMAASD